MSSVWHIPLSKIFKPCPDIMESCFDVPGISKVDTGFIVCACVCMCVCVCVKVCRWASVGVCVCVVLRLDSANFSFFGKMLCSLPKLLLKQKKLLEICINVFL